MHRHRRFRLLVSAATLVALAPLAGCGDDADGSAEPVVATADTDPAPTTAAAPEGSVVHIVMDDFHYDGIPEEVAAGTRITVSNNSPGEIHEFVAFRLDDSEQRPVAEIVAGDLGAMLASSEPATVLIAPPGGEMIPAVGDGTLADPGRYLILCVIPTGADPDAYLAAAATSDGPPDVEGGPPHVANGMFAEIVVTG